MKRTIFFASVLAFCLFLPLGSKDARIYKYMDKDGNWAFTNDPSLVPELNETDRERPAERELVQDLAKRLAGSHPPKNKIEEARNATVVIKSSKGLGSGFFITEDGYILTNRHVVKAEKEDEARLAITGRGNKWIRARLHLLHRGGQARAQPDGIEPWQHELIGRNIEAQHTEHGGQDEGSRPLQQPLRTAQE